MKKSTPITLLVFLLVLSLRSQNFSENFKSAKPLSFKENKGQVSDQFFKPRTDILFSGVAGDMAFYLRSTGVSYQLTRVDKWKEIKRFFKPLKPGQPEQVPASTTFYRVDIDWLNVNPTSQVERGENLPGYDNYYLASCPDGALHVKSFSHISYKNIYPGIDLKWYEKQGNLKYDYYVSANSDYKKIQLEYKGAEKIFVDASGELIIETPLGTLREQAPVVMQANQQLNARWIVKDNVVSFDIKNADPSLPMIIDPMVRLWATYFGGPGYDYTSYMHTNSAGDLFIAGATNSAANIATTGAHQTTLAGSTQFSDGFLAKFNSAGVIQWATYYGGSGDEYTTKSVSDPSGDVYVTGRTESGNPGAIATPGSHQAAYSATINPGDAFLVKFNSAGIRKWGTYYGGDDEEYAWGIALDNTGIYISGGSVSTSGISTPGSYQPVQAGNGDSFIAKFSSQGVRLWGTYYGGSAYDNGGDCSTNGSGDIYINGITSSSNGIALPGAHQSTYGGGAMFGGDGYFMKINQAGVPQWATYYGGPANESAADLAVDPSGNLYAVGQCQASIGTIIATPGSHQPTYGGGAGDAFLVKFDAAGVRQWGTYYGGTAFDGGVTPAVDPAGNVYMLGTTGGSTGTVISTPCSYQPVYAGGSSDGFLAKFTSSGVRLWGTYYGSIFTENCNHTVADGSGNIYISGTTLASSGTVMATTNGYQPVYGGGSADAFIAKFDGCIPGNISSQTPAANLLVCSGNTTTLSASCGNWYSSPTGTFVLGSGGTFTAGPIVADTTFYIEDFGCGSITGTRTAIQVTLAPQATLTLLNSNPAACVSESVVLSASGASSYTWTGPFGSSSTTSTLQVYILLNSTYSLAGTDANGCESTATISIAANQCTGIEENGNMGKEMIVYPNPNKGDVTIRSSSELELILSNELGQKIKDLSLSASNNYSVILNDLPEGVYFISGEKEAKILNKKIIVVR